MNGIWTAPGKGLSPERLTATLQRLGPVYVKIGQFLAVRPDLLPQAYCDAFLQLTDAAERVPWPDVRNVILAELGGEPEALFSRFDRAPLAAASLAQVHLARTHAGQEVAVKVQRHGLAEQIRRNLRGARRLLRVLGAAGVTGGIDADELADEVERWLEQELDFNHERQNMLRAGRLMRDTPNMRMPRSLRRLSTSRVLTQTYLQGLPVSEAVRLLRGGRRSALSDLGVDPDRVARNLLLSIYAQAFQHGFFHADPHPGNLLILPGDVVGFVDFGLCEALTEARRANQSAFVAAAYAGNLDGVYRELRRALIAGPAHDEDAFRERFLEITSAWLKTRGDGTERFAPSGRSYLAQYLIDLMALARDSDVRMPADLLALYRTLLTGETLASELSEHVDLVTVARGFFAQQQFDRVIEGLTPQRFQSSGLDLLRLGMDGPGQLSRLLGDLADDRFVLRVRAEDAPVDRKLAHARAQLVALSVLTIGPAVFGGLALSAGRSLLAAAAGLGFMALLVAVAAAWRRLR